jgi:hypothetical protein
VLDKLEQPVSRLITLINSRFRDSLKELGRVEVQGYSGKEHCMENNVGASMIVHLLSWTLPTVGSVM